MRQSMWGNKYVYGFALKCLLSSPHQVPKSSWMYRASMIYHANDPWILISLYSISFSQAKPFMSNDTVHFHLNYHLLQSIFLELNSYIFTHKPAPSPDFLASVYLLHLFFQSLSIIFGPYQVSLDIIHFSYPISPFSNHMAYILWDANKSWQWYNK